MKRGSEVAVINHYNIRRVIDICGTPQERDLGAVSSDMQRIVDAHRKALPRGTFITVRGQVETNKVPVNTAFPLSTSSCPKAGQGRRA